MVHRIRHLLSNVTILIIAIGLFHAVSGDSGNSAGNKATERQDPARKTIKMGISEMDVTFYFNMARILYTKAFSSLGYDFKLYSLPSERVLIEVNTGRLDADAGRIAFDSINAKKYPNMIRVPTFIAIIDNAGYTLDSTIKISGWEDVKKRGFNVGYIRGSISVGRKIREYIAPDLRFEIKDLYQGFEMLRLKRIDLFVGPSSSIETALEQPALKSMALYKAGVLSSFEIYPYFNKKHRLLVPQLARVLEEMKKDGTFQRIIKEVKRQSASGNL